MRSQLFDDSTQEQIESSFDTITNTDSQRFSSAERIESEGSPWVLSRTRRCFEFIAAALVFVATFPVMICTAIIIRLDSTGPILFRQKRMGRNGQEFMLFKFRSMREQDGRSASVTASLDSRITRVGAVLRRFKIDELPQLWNVLRGDIGLVGPRPKLPHLEPLYMKYRPGITGAATLVFRHEEDLLATVPQDQVEEVYELYVKPAKANIDLQYMRAATFASDMNLIWKTLAACFRRESQDDLMDMLGLFGNVNSIKWSEDQLRWVDERAVLQVGDEA